MQSHPYFVELLHGLAHQLRLIGEDTRLKVAGVGSFHADARAGEVRAAEIGRAAVKDEHLEVNTGTEHPL